MFIVVCVSVYQCICVCVPFLLLAGHGHANWGSLLSAFQGPVRNRVTWEMCERALERPDFSHCSGWCAQMRVFEPKWKEESESLKGPGQETEDLGMRASAFLPKPPTTDCGISFPSGHLGGLTWGDPRAFSPQAF